MDDREAFHKAVSDWIDAVIKFVENNNKNNNKDRGKTMEDREAFYIALYELLDKGINALEDESEISLAMSRLNAAKTLLANELRFIKKVKEKTNEN
jgi:hypothetical protein